ncbi:MAG: glycosyltransferase family 39 protein [Candidatus Omnitrophota bacterium]
MKNKTLLQILILIALSYIAFTLGNSILDLTNPDEVFYAQTTKEMIQRGTWITPYLFGHPQFEKPVLIYWLMRSGALFFGVTNFGMRVVPSLFGIIGVIAVYLLGLGAFKDRTKAFVSALIFMTAGISIGLARCVMTDLTFSVLILLAVASFYAAYTVSGRKTSGLIFFCIFSALAVLTKGPLGFMIPTAIVILFLALRNEIKFIICRQAAAGLLLFIVIALPWYALMIWRHGHYFTHEFFYNDHLRRIMSAEHLSNDRWYFYPGSMIGGMFPWSFLVVFALALLPVRLKNEKDPFYLFMLCWLVVVFATFQFAHSKLISYIYPLFPALALIAGDHLCRGAIAPRRKSVMIPLIMTFVVFLAVPVALKLVLMKNGAKLPSRVPFYFLMLEFLLASAWMVMPLLKREIVRVAHIIAAAMLLTVCVLPFATDYVTLYASSRAPAEYLVKNASINNIILVSMPFVRGVRYYTGKDVAVIDLPGKQFFSPHPIPFYGANDGVKAFLRSQDVTYCVLKKVALEDIRRIGGSEFRYTVMTVVGNEYVVKVEHV